MPRYVTIRLKWKIGLKAALHFNRIVMYRSIFFCVEVISSTLVLRKQRNTLCFGTIRLKWKTGYGDQNLRERPSFVQQSRHIRHYAYNFGQLETGFVVSKTKNIQRLTKIFSVYFQRLFKDL
jgi:hypothetical protein